jgi:hypothetical protein
MTRRCWRIFLGTLVGLLMLASSASAECAWVLWIKYSERGRADEPQRPLLAYQTKEECEKGIDERVLAAAERSSRTNDYAVARTADTVHLLRGCQRPPHTEPPRVGHMEPPRGA